MSKTYQIHGVLGGAYKSKAQLEASLLYHASTDEGETALCGRVKEGHLADIYSTEPDQTVSCERCAAKVAKLGLELAPQE